MKHILFLLLFLLLSCNLQKDRDLEQEKIRNAALIERQEMLCAYTMESHYDHKVVYLGDGIFMWPMWPNQKKYTYDMEAECDAILKPYKESIVHRRKFYGI